LSWEAKALMEPVRESFARTLGEDHELTLIAATNLAGMLVKIGDDEHAREVYEDVIARHERLGRGEQREALTTMENYAQVLAKPSDASRAEELQRRVLDTRLRLYPDDGMAIAHSHAGLGYTLMLQRRFEEAEAELRQTVGDFERLVGPDHDTAMNARSSHARVLVELGCLDEAEPILRRCVEYWRVQRGEDHYDTLLAKNSLAFVLAKQGRYDESLEISTSIALACERNYGDDHPTTRMAWLNLAAGFKRAGRDDEAVVIHERFPPPAR